MTNLYLEPASNPTKNSRLHTLTINNDLDAYNIQNPPIPIENLHFTSGDYIQKYNIQAGDYVLFYVGDRKYRYAGKIKQTANLPEIVEKIEEKDGKGGDICEKGLIFDSIHEVSISGEYISKIGEWDIKYLITFTRFTEDQLENLYEDYSSIEDFINSSKV